MWGALVLLWCGGRAGHVDNWSHTACPVSPGSESRANGHEGFTGTWETLPVSNVKCRPEPGLPNSRLIRNSRPGLWGRTGDTTLVSPNEGNEVRREGRQGVAVPHSTVEPGEPT